MCEDIDIGAKYRLAKMDPQIAWVCLIAPIFDFQQLCVGLTIFKISWQEVGLNMFYVKIYTRKSNDMKFIRTQRTNACVVHMLY